VNGVPTRHENVSRAKIAVENASTMQVTQTGDALNRDEDHG